MYMKNIHKLWNIEVGGTEVKPPHGNAVRFIDDEHADCQFPRETDKFGGEQAFRRNIKELASARPDNLHLFPIFFRAHIADKISGLEHPIREIQVEIGRLVMNQGDQRSYHQCQPLQFDCRILITQGFS